MEASILKKAGEFLKEKSRRKYWLTAVTALSIAVIFATVQILMSPARAMVGGTYCGKEEHEHTEECYELVLICGYDEEGLPVQQDPKPAPEDEPTEGAQESAENVQESTENAQEPVGEVHELSEEVTNAAGAPHVHDDSCYIVESVLVCQLEETEGHVHTEECYATIQTLICDEGTEALTAQDDSQPADSELEEADGGSTEPEEDSTDGTAESEEGETAESEEHETDETAEFEENEAESSEESETDEAVESEENEAKGSEESETDEAVEPEENENDGPEEGETDDVTDAEEGESDEAGELVEPHVHTDECYMRVLVCEKEEHKHTNKCYEDPDTLVYYCEYEVHEHTEECYDENGSLVCGRADFVVHTHTEDCYNARGELVCPLPEIEAHVHTEECYGRTKDGETESHTHTEECYDGNGELICGEPEEPTALEEDVSEEPAELTCGREEIELHTHTGECYDEDGALICGRLEVLEHVHSAECRIEPEIEEFTYYCLESIHEHTEECYDENGSLICGKADYAVHTHTRKCYGVDGTLICPLPELEAHVHTEECYPDGAAEPVCGKEEIVLHTHTEECYNENGALICGRLEVLEHVHSEDCKVEPENEELIYYCLENVHEHTAECYDENGGLICGKADYVVHTHTKNCYGTQGLLICPLPEIEAHVHTEECYLDGTEEPVCGKEEIEIHIHTEECYDENGTLICSKLEVLEHVHNEDCKVSHKLITKVYEGENFIVMAVYTAKANLPKEAVLIAEQITKESDEEHYAEREAQYQEVLEDESAIMRALLKIGFYVNGEEVEPEAPVTISIQFLDEDGLLEGSPITIVHFAEEGTGVLDGGEAVDNSTTFRTDSFSEFAVGYATGEEKTVLISDSFQYDDTALHISFHIEGEATVINKMQETISPARNERTVTSDADKKLVLWVRVLDESEERYQAYSDYLESGGEKDDTLFLQVMSFRLFYGDRELDLSDCVIKAQVEPKMSLVESTQSMAAQEEAESTNFLSVLTLSPDGAAAQENAVEMVPEEQISAGLSVESFFAESRELTEEDGTAEPEIKNGIEKGDEFEEAADGEGADLAVVVKTVVNPMFIVQFYANLNVPESTTGTSNTTLPFIDTSTNTGLGRLPRNGDTNPKEISLGLNTDGTVVFHTRATEIYRQETKEFNPKLGDELNINYLNSLRDNVHYEVRELWVLNEIEGESEEARAERMSATSREDGNWAIYNLTNGGSESIAFTNNMDIAGGEDENGRTYVGVERGTVMRLVYDPAADSYSSKATFYDYDISAGPKTAATMDTKNSGINSYLPETGNARFAFGNSNMGTIFQNDTLSDGSTLNQYNRGRNTYMGLTLGLVQSMTNENGVMDVNFNSGITGPSIGVFGSASGKGKIIYGNWNLNFNRAGDTFTLSSVSMSNNVSVASELEKFGHPGKYDGTNGNKIIWTNNFWPLDAKWPDQSSILDPMFGGATMPKRSNGTGTASVPPSDDGIDHNSYFGMTYSVNFDLVEEYVGPLEYYFYGDDDMWVFLDGVLVCDIGGVHSSVGEYVDLWDYISGGREGHKKGQHTLSIFYTERGASGSSCWMQFTLPQISQIYNEPYDPDDASLTIEKVAVQFPEDMADTAFPFVLKLSGIYNQYTVKHHGYRIEMDDNGEEVKSEIVEADTISTDEYPFTLKNGEWLEVIGLPIGTTYWVEEKYAEGSWDTTVDTTVNNADSTTRQNMVRTVLAHGTLGGNVVEGKDQVDNVTITYTNIYLYKLPETGGTGTILYTMAGTITILFGAGFLYRKKFRERRAQTSL